MAGMIKLVVVYRREESLNLGAKESKPYVTD